MGTVMSRISRARVALRAALEGRVRPPQATVLRRVV
jgi:DNA-directed RNA polymerase specialized sigma24 family protein